MLGCTTKVPTPVQYKIDTQDVKSKVLNSECSDKSIKILPAYSSNTFLTTSMYYVEDKNKIYAYTKSKWATSPNSMITQYFESLLKDMQLYKYVINSKSRAVSDLVLEIKIDDFMQYYSKDYKKSYVKVILSLNIIDVKKAKVIKSAKYTKTLDATPLDASGGVDALKSALDDISKQSYEFFKGGCK